MKLLHATLRFRAESILREGVDPCRSLGKRAASWWHTPALTRWAILHTMLRHGGGLSRREAADLDVVVLGADIPRGWLRRFGQRGLWYCETLVPPARITATYNGVEWGAALSI